MKTHLIRALAAAAFLGALSFAPESRAGDVYVTDGIAIKGHDPVAFFSEGKPVRGRDGLRVEHAGASYLFASPANRDAFAANPGKYLPQYGGYCAFGVSRGYKAVIDPAAFTIVDGRLYLNYNAAVQKEWRQDRENLIRQANGRWEAVRMTEKVLR